MLKVERGGILFLKTKTIQVQYRDSPFSLVINTEGKGNHQKKKKKEEEHSKSTLNKFKRTMTTIINKTII